MLFTVAITSAHVGRQLLAKPAWQHQVKCTCSYGLLYGVSVSPPLVFGGIRATCSCVGNLGCSRNFTFPKVLLQTDTSACSETESSKRAARIVAGCFFQEVSSDHSNHGVFDLLAELVHMSGTQGHNFVVWAQCSLIQTRLDTCCSRRLLFILTYWAWFWFC